MSSPLHPTEQFNPLPEEEKKRLFSSGLGLNLLRSGLPFAIPLWWVFENSATGIGLRNGSAFLADLGHGVFAVSAAHVFKQYLADKRSAIAIGCQLGDILFDPETQLICCRDDLDIATFRVSTSEVRQIDKAIVTPGPPNWGPLSPGSRRFCILCRFPGTDAWHNPERQLCYCPLPCHARDNERDRSSDCVSNKSAEDY